MTKTTLFLTMLLLILMLSINALAAVPNTLSYQGTLTDKAGNPITAAKTIDFKLYNVVSGGTALWTETQNVAVTNGKFGVVLGIITPLDQSIFTGNTWIGLTVQGETEMTPRQKITSVAYSFVAGKVLDQSITAASIGEPCVTGQSLVKAASGWICGNVASAPLLYKPANFTLAGGLQYVLSPTATNTTVLTSGNYIVPNGVYFITIEAVGGGGGGTGCRFDGANRYAGVAGGSGEYVGTYLAVTPGSTISVSYGAAGIGSPYGYPPDGGNGGDTIVAYNSLVYLTAHGGKGGYREVASGYYYNGAGGSGSTDPQHLNGTLGGAGPFITGSTINSGGARGLCSPTIENGSAGTAGAVAISYVLP